MRDALVDDGVVDVEDEPADEGRVHLHLDLGLVPGAFLHQGGEPLQEFLRRRHGHSQVRLPDALAPAVSLLEIQQDETEGADPAVAEQQVDEAGQFRMHRLAEGRLQQFALLGVGHYVLCRDHPGQVGNLAEDTGQPFRLRADGIAVPGLPNILHQGVGIPGPDDAVVHE